MTVTFSYMINRNAFRLFSSMSPSPILCDKLNKSNSTSHMTPSQCLQTAIIPLPLTYTCVLFLSSLNVFSSFSQFPYYIGFNRRCYPDVSVFKSLLNFYPHNETKYSSCDFMNMDLNGSIISLVPKHFV